MPQHDKLYLVVRKDLSPAQQAVQAAHGLAEFSALHWEIFSSWRADSSTLALLEVANEEELQALLVQATYRGVEAAEFREPDLGGEITAVAVGPRGKRLCRGFRLALDQK